MPTAPTYPGVYIEEVPSGVRTITGVATSVAAFLGYFSRGPMNRAVRIFNFGDFDRAFGGLRPDSEAAYAIQQFFLNGGGQAYVVRTAVNATAAAIALADDPDAPTALLELEAASEGAWGNSVRALVDYNTADPTATFNLTVVEEGVVNGRVQALATEVFRNLTFDPTQPRYVVDVVNGASVLVTATVVGTPAAVARPAHSGTLSGALPSPLGLGANEEMTVDLNGGGALTVELGTTPPATPAALASELQAQIRSADPTLEGVSVRVIGSAASQQRLVVSTPVAGDVVTFADGAGSLASTLGLDAADRTNVQQYVLGAAAAAGAQVLPGAPAAQQAGSDGTAPGAAELIGEEDPKTGIYALLDVDLFNLLSIPDTMRLPDADAAQVAASATALAERERAFYILDAPQPANDPLDLPAEIETWLDENASLRHKNAALYYPRPVVPDPLNEFRLREVAPSGTMAGVYARTDGTRGVWKAPAGTEAVLRGTQRLEYELTDAENGVLNPLGINALRTFPVFGSVAWGARTLDGADQLASEWKYVPVRRLALFIEESLFRGTQWVVFEPNDETLWAQIRLNVGTFMHTLFRQGAFQGAKPDAAYFVKCDAEVNPQADIDRGIVNVVVGFAPLKPAEFVIVKIQQMAGQLEV